MIRAIDSKCREGLRVAVAALVLAVGVLTIVAGPAVAAPANDSFAAATTLSGIAVALAGQSNVAATGEVGERTHAFSSLGANCSDATTRFDPGPTFDPTCLPSVWYAWTPAATTSVAIDTCDPAPGPGSLANSVLAVYTGIAVDTLTQVVADDDAPGPPPGCRPTDSRVTFRAVAGTTYRIAVAGFQASTGTFALHLLPLPRPGNDDFASAITLSGDAVDLRGQTNEGATGQTGEPNHAGNSLSAVCDFVAGICASDCTAATSPDPTCEPSVWYVWTAARTFNVTIDTCDALPDFSSTLAVYTGSSVDALSNVAGNDDSSIRGGTPNCDPISSRVTFRALAGTTYRIAVGGSLGQMGHFPLHLFVQPRPGNDDFSAATPLSGDSIDLAGQTTLAATGEPGEPDHAGVALRTGCADATTPDNGCISSVWYAWSSPVAALVTIDLCDAATTTDTTLAVYTGGSVDALSTVAADDDADPPCPAGQPAFASRVSFTAAAGTVYRIAVADFARQGPFVLHLRSTPAPPSAPPVDPGTPGPAPPPGPGPGVGDATAPVVTGFRLTNTTFAVARGSTPLTGSAAVVRHRRGSAFGYRLSEAAAVRIAIGRVSSGRRRAGRCVAASPALRHARRCVRVVGQAVLKRKSALGANRVVFTGRVEGRALPPGRYRATLTATDAAGNRATPRTITFTITRR